MWKKFNWVEFMGEMYQDVNERMDKIRGCFTTNYEEAINRINELAGFLRGLEMATNSMISEENNEFTAAVDEYLESVYDELEKKAAFCRSQMKHAA